MSDDPVKCANCGGVLIQEVAGSGKQYWVHVRTRWLRCFRQTRIPTALPGHRDPLMFDILRRIR